MTIKILELFGGIGSPRIALRRMGVPTKAIDYVEIDTRAVDSYNAIFSGELRYKTQSVVGYDLKPDILIHGSPCQDLSVAGKKLGAEKGSGTRSSLMWETLNIIEQMGEWRPKYVIWENVRGVLQKRMRGVFDQYLSEMERLGYTNEYRVLNAMDFGLPQNRDRVFTVSKLGNEPFNFDKLRTRPMQPIEDFLEDEAEPEYTITQPSMLAKIGPDDDMSFSWGLKPIDKFAWTITTKQLRCPNSGIVPLGKGKYRLLTPKECWLLQGYTAEEFEAAASVNGKTNLYKQAGNSIPVPIFESMFEVILEELGDSGAISQEYGT